jgi:hypothetical protein
MADTQQREAARYERGQRGAILQNLAARGVAGSGMELAAELAAAQSGANRVADYQADLAGAAQQRALQSLAASADLGTRMRASGFQERSAIEDFNRRNVERRLEAQSVRPLANRPETARVPQKDAAIYSGGISRATMRRSQQSRRPYRQHRGRRGSLI